MGLKRRAGWNANWSPQKLKRCTADVGENELFRWGVICHKAYIQETSCWWYMELYIYTSGPVIKTSGTSASAYRLCWWIGKTNKNISEPLLVSTRICLKDHGLPITHHHLIWLAGFVPHGMWFKTCVNPWLNPWRFWCFQYQGGMGPGLSSPNSLAPVIPSFW